MALWIATLGVLLLVNFPEFRRRLFDFLLRHLWVSRRAPAADKLASRRQSSASSETVESSVGSLLETTATAETVESASKDDSKALLLDSSSKHDARKCVRFGSLSRIDEKMSEDSEPKKYTGLKRDLLVKAESCSSQVTFSTEPEDDTDQLNNYAAKFSLDSIQSSQRSSPGRNDESTMKSMESSLSSTDPTESTSIPQCDDQATASVLSFRDESVQSDRSEEAIQSTGGSSVNTDTSRKSHHSELSKRLRVRLAQGHTAKTPTRYSRSRPFASVDTLNSSTADALTLTKDRRTSVPLRVDGKVEV